MKKTIAALFAIASAAVFADMNDVKISFHSLYTPDVDRYADGTQVLDGEWYALVCTKDGKKEIVDAAPLAVGGRCPRYFFTIKGSDVENYSGGVLEICLLDTREFGEDSSGAKLTEKRDEKGYPSVVNVMAAASGAMATTSRAVVSPAEDSVSAGSYDLASAGVNDPTVTDIKVVGDEVLVTVANTVPFVGYTLQSGDDKFSFMALPDVKSVNGNASGTITLKAPKKDGAQFFKVSSIQ
jgi:hypothetical protein